MADSAIDTHEAGAEAVTATASMRPMTMIEAIRDAHEVLMLEDSNVVALGEDVGYFGGVFRCTDGLQARFGPDRCIDTPINESGIIGVAIGMATFGLRPIAEVQFADYVYPGFDQLASEAARIRSRTAGELSCPLVVRAPCGGGIHGGQTHSQSPEALFCHIAGMTVVIPSNPYDAKGLLIAAVESNDPVMFFEPKRLYNGPFDGHHDRPIEPWRARPEALVPSGRYRVDLGVAATVRTGDEVTVLAYGTMVHVAVAASDESGVAADIIDLRTLLPLDVDMIVESVRRTGRCVIVHEATRTGGFGAELSAQVQERCFEYLEAPIRRVTGWDTPYPMAQEWEYFPSPTRVAEVLVETVRYR